MDAHPEHLPACSHVLVVDDELGIRQLLQYELTRRGYSVELACDGAEAIAAVQDREFDLVISDIRMPKADGIAVLEAVKAAAPATEVIVMTGYAELASAIACVRGGAFDFVNKPFDLQAFMATIGRAIDHRRFRFTSRLYAACCEILSGKATPALYERIGLSATELLDADDASVMLSDGEQLHIVYASGLSDELRVETKVALGDRVAGRVLRDREPAILTGSLDDDARFANVDSDGRVRSGIVYPLVYGDDALGVLSVNRVASTRPFRQADLETAGIIAAQAAVAIHNERLKHRLLSTERLTTIGQMAAGIVHEINNPLTTVVANANFALELVDSGDLATIGECLRDVNEGAERLLEIVSDMRGLSRGNQDEPTRLDVNEALRSALRLAGVPLTAVTLSLELGEGLFVSGRRGPLSQILVNLIVNACQALESSSTAEPSVGVESRREGDEVLVAVTDNGPGISPAELLRVMEPLYTTKSHDVGTGLGLSISRDIAEQHGGSLSVYSEQGQGATFTLRLPAMADG